MSQSAHKVAVVHDWLTGMRGGEAVLEAILELYPEADLFTLVADPYSVSRAIRSRRIVMSPLQKFPQAVQRYRHYLPLMPWAIEQLDVSRYDLVISSSHCVAKGVRKGDGARHVSYVHAPMRYMWDRFDDYFGPGRASLPVRAAAKVLRPHFQRWDRRTSQPGPRGVDAWVANSAFIAARMKEFWGVDARVIHPFADLSRFDRPRTGGRSYVMIGAFAPYKRVDLAIEAFNRLKLPLLIVGGGQEEARLRRMAGPTVDFLGQLSNAAITDILSKARAFVFPGLEDFGITPIEAMASGTPVIAYGAGGALESVTEQTGIFFREQTVDAFCAAIEEMERRHVEFDPANARARAQLFSKERFQREFRELMNQV
jgi:glycosyltransferase involved in cell wall biosynthesis